MTVDILKNAEDSWSVLDLELNTWKQSGRIADFWWRDDDAVSAGPKLEKLLKISAGAGLLLAVIPVHLDRSLISVIGDTPDTWIAQHGYAHINHAPRGQGLGAWELGLHRETDDILDELMVGQKLLLDSFGSDFLPVIVPPWNKIARELFTPLSIHGYCGVSTFGMRSEWYLTPEFVAVNAHCDPISWKSGAAFTGTSKAINQITDHLKAKRLGQADEKEPTGLLTHHIVLDEPGWQFCSDLTALIHNHPGAQWVSPLGLFPRQT